MLDNGIGSWPARRARMTPAKPALVETGGSGATVTYGELAALVEQAAEPG